jgi:glycerol uptake facilitator protein
MLIEALGTALLLFFIFALVDRGNRDAPGANLAPFFIGFAVASFISVLAPLTQAGLNPARDFGARLFALFAGWGTMARRGHLQTVYSSLAVCLPLSSDDRRRRCRQ